MGPAYARLSLTALTLLTLAACEPQFSPLYTGESLLTITGSVEIALERHDALIVPALAFTTPTTGDVMIREVDVQGEFPADFRLDVYQPPPKGAYFNATFQSSGEPRLAAAYVTAVSTDHPDTIRPATSQSVESFGCQPDACDRPCGGKGCLLSRESYCRSDDSAECYVEETYCPTFSSAMEQCTTEAVAGDPALKESPWVNFAGFSQNYMVVYLEKPAAAGSVTAAILGSHKQVSAGYGLYSIRLSTTDELAARDECIKRAEVRAAPGFNAEYGTNLSTLEFYTVCAPTSIGTPPAPGETMKLPPAPTGFAAPFCGSSIDELDKLQAASDARERYVERAKLELGCQMREWTVERVEHPANESVSVIISPEVQPVLWPI